MFFLGEGFGSRLFLDAGGAQDEPQSVMDVFFRLVRVRVHGVFAERFGDPSWPPAATDSSDATARAAATTPSMRRLILARMLSPEPRSCIGVPRHARAATSKADNIRRMTTDFTPSEFHVEKQRADAVVTLSSGESSRGCFFVAGGSASHAGPERVGDVLNAEAGFFPFEIQDAGGRARSCSTAIMSSRWRSPTTRRVAIPATASRPGGSRRSCYRTVSV